MSTVPPGSSISTSTVSEEVTAASQSQLQKECKRQQVSTNGCKTVFAERLSIVGLKTKQDVVRVATEFDEDGPISRSSGEVVVGDVGLRQTKFSGSDLARLAHVIMDPPHYTVFAAIHRRPGTRAELDKTRNDPWSNEFEEAFNDEDYRPSRPLPVDGVTCSIISLFHPEEHPYFRTGNSLKTKWAWTWSRYTVCHKNYSKSGQGEFDIFPNLIDGQPIMSYVHCLFKHSPSLEIVLRELGDVLRAESGLGKSPTAERTSTANSAERYFKSQKRTAPLGEGLSKIAESLAAPVEMNLRIGGMDRSGSALEADNRLEETVSSLMGLERQIRTDIKGALEAHEEQYVSVLQERFVRVQDKISKCLF